MKLTKKDVKKVRAFLYDVREKWYCIGVGLHINSVELELIKVQFPDNPSACLVEVVTLWLKSKHHSTWGSLASALKAEGVNEMKLAEEALSKEQETTMSKIVSDGAEVESTSLTRWDVRHVRALLLDIKKKWHDIGIELEIDVDKLSKIRMQHGDDPALCLLEMITLWLKFINNPPKWETLADALKCRVINEEELAKKALSKVTGPKESEVEQGTVLTRYDLKNVKKFLRDVDGKKWMDVGIDLGLDIDVLFKIRAKYGDDPDACMWEMITVWLKFVSPQPTWGILSNALRANNEVELADEASLKYKEETEVNPQDQEQKYELTRWELKQVRGLLFDVREKWFDIGVDLEIDADILKNIRDKYHNEPAACLTNMIREWLKSVDRPATWASLAFVLRSINEVKLAEEASLKDKSLSKEQNQDATESTVLCRLDLKQVRELLLEVKDKWLDIGIELGVDIDVLFKIKSEFKNNPADCLREMIRAWLKFYDPLPSLETLCEALHSKYVDAVDLAKQALEIHPSTEEIETGEQNEEAHQDDDILCRRHVKKVRTYLFDVKNKWMDIGIELKIDIDILVKIRQRYNNDPAECLLEMIVEWLKFIDPPPTRDALIMALQARSVDEKKLAKNLEQGFIFEDGSLTDATREEQSSSEEKSGSDENEASNESVSNATIESETFNENTALTCNLEKLDKKPCLHDMEFATNIKNGRQYTLIKYISGHWKVIGSRLGITHNDLSNIHDEKISDEDRFKKVMNKWIENAIGLPNAIQYPYTWVGLYQLLLDSELGTYAEDYIRFMESKYCN